MERIARDQVAYVRSNHPGYNCGGRLLLAELTPDTLSVRTIAELEAHLCHAELRAAQWSASIKRRKEIWEALHPAESGAARTSLGGRENTSFAAGCRGRKRVKDANKWPPRPR